MMRKSSTCSIYYVISQAGPGAAPHNGTHGCFFREMCAYSHLVGYIKSIYSLVSVQIRFCHQMSLCLQKSFACFIAGLILFNINIECLFILVMFLALSSAFSDIHIAALAFCLCLLGIPLGSFNFHPFFVTQFQVCLIKIPLLDLCFLTQLTAKSLDHFSPPASPSLPSL